MWMPHILLVDDEIFTNRLITQQLTRNGFEITSAASATAAWRQLMDPTQFHDLIILDRVLPDMDATCFLQRLKAIEKLKYIPVIMITAEASYDEFIEATAEGVAEFIYKPINMDLLLFAIGNALEKQYRRIAQFN